MNIGIVIVPFVMKEITCFILLVMLRYVDLYYLTMFYNTYKLSDMGALISNYK